MLVRVLMVCLLLVGTGTLAARDVVLDADGGLVADLPHQEMLDSATPVLQRAGFELTPVARFEMKGRVLGQLAYDADTVAELSPVDIALGWGAMSDSRVLSHFEVRESVSSTGARSVRQFRAPPSNGTPPIFMPFRPRRRSSNGCTWCARMMWCSFPVCW